jgi:hypothetical protein
MIAVVSSLLGLACALTAAPAWGQPPAHEDVGLPTTAPPVAHVEQVGETTAAGKPSESSGVAVFALLGPLGLALGGLTTAASFSSLQAPRLQPAPRLHPLAPVVAPRLTSTPQ